MQRQLSEIEGEYVRHILSEISQFNKKRRVDGQLTPILKAYYELKLSKRTMRDTGYQIRKVSLYRGGAVFTLENEMEENAVFDGNQVKKDFRSTLESWIGSVFPKGERSVIKSEDFDVKYFDDPSRIYIIPADKQNPIAKGFMYALVKMASPTFNR